MEASSFTAEKALAESLSRLAAVEEDNRQLKCKLQQLVKEPRTVEEGGGSRELERLRKQNKELMHVNNQWDLEYKELDEAFHKYRIDSKKAQGDSQTQLSRLKDSNDSLRAEIRELQGVISRREKENVELRSKIRGLEDELRSSRLGKPVVSQERVRELEEEIHMLRQQLKAYQDDFNAERRDRERMNEEKESAAIRYEAEVTSLKLQLERCRNELAHYTAEANRLSQQLRLKSQMEEEQYKRHLESNGYITRSASGHLPPLDPFVDIDEDNTMSRSRSPARLLTRGVDLVQAYSKSQGAQAYPGPQRAASEDTERSRSPIIGQNYHGSVPQVQVPSAATNGAINGVTNSHHPNGSRASNFRPNIPPSMTNGSASSQRHNGYSNGVADVHSNLRRGGYNTDDGVKPALYPEERVIAPPLETRGKYSCPRCDRRFESKQIWTDHKIRCIV